MIKIVYKKNYLEISGHAYSSERDIVCAAISSIVCSAYIKWEGNIHFLLTEDSKKPCVSFFIKEEKNKNNSKEYIEFDFLVFLLKQVSLNYPENIHWLE